MLTLLRTSQWHVLKRRDWSLSIQYHLGHTARWKTLWLFFCLWLMWLCDLTSQAGSPSVFLLALPLFIWYADRADCLCPCTQPGPRDTPLQAQGHWNRCWPFLYRALPCAFLGCSRIQLVQAGWTSRRHLLEQKQHGDGDGLWWCLCCQGDGVSGDILKNNCSDQRLSDLEDFRLRSTKNKLPCLQHGRQLLVPSVWPPLS